MKLFRYQNFIKESKEDIDSICKKYNIQNYTINEDGSVDVDGSVNLNYVGLTELPLKFRKVSGSFYCNNNKLTSLEGAPHEVGGSFYCSNNQLTSLEGAPNKVGRSFSCHNNQLKSLERSPIRIGRGFDCSDNRLTSLEGSPEKVGGSFYCHNNKLTTLEGISKYISVGINCRYNKIIDVRGVKDGWRGVFLVEDNPIHEIFKLFPEKRRDEVVEYLNEYNVIRDGKVILQALEQVYWELGIEVPEIDELEGYEIQY
jgi:hypothetical protein